MPNRTFPIVGAISLAVVGSIITAAAATALVLDRNGPLTTGSHSVSTRTTAIVTSVDDLEGTDGIATVLGRPRLHLDVHGSGTPVFIGVGHAADVERYLDGVDIDRVTDVDVDPFQLDVSHRAGDRVASPPATQSIWVARSTGTDPVLDWKVRDGDYRIVVMAADGRPGFTVHASAAVHIPHLVALAIVALGLGILLLAVAALVVVRVARRAAPTRVGTPYPETAGIG
jgi:hypothetical protein